MTDRVSASRFGWLCLLIFWAALWCAGPALAQRQDDKAIKILREMLLKFRDTQNMAFTISASEERVFKDMVPLNFVYEFSVKLEGEDRIKIELPRPDGLSKLYYYDGIMSYYDVTRNIYTEGDFTGRLDQLVDILRDEFQLTLPGLDIVNRNMSNVIGQWTPQALYVGIEVLPEGNADHLAFFSDTIDWQIWIYQDSGLPGYLIVTFKRLDGTPQTHIRYGNWNLDPKFSENEFRFTPPADAKQFKLPDYGDTPAQPAKEPEQQQEEAQ